MLTFAKNIIDDSNMCTIDLHDDNVNTYINFAYNQLFGKQNSKDCDFNPNKLLKEDFSRFNNFRDWYSVMETAKNEGIAEGRAEGRAEGEAVGIQKGRAEAAHKMIEAGIPAKKVLEILGLTKEDIQ